MSDRMTSFMQEQPVLSRLWSDPRLLVVLGWLAQGYAQRRTLRNPAGLVYRRLQRGDQPLRRYLEQPEKYLPPACLARIGRVSYAPVDPDDPTDPGEEEHLDGEETQGEEAVDPSLLSEVNGRTALRAWEQALQLLQGELSPGSYQAYLGEVRPRVWEAEGRLVVRAPTAYVRDWLNSRVRATMGRMLGGYWGRR